MSNLFLIGIYVLVAGNVLACAAVFVFLFLFLKRQKQGFQYMVSLLMEIEKTLKAKKTDPKKTQLSIPVDEPIAKYESVSLPDDVKINFIED